MDRSSRSHHPTPHTPRRALSLLSALSLLLAGLGVMVGTGGTATADSSSSSDSPPGSSSRVAPKILSADYTPNFTLFNSDAPVRMEGTVRVQVDRTAGVALRLSDSGLADTGCSFFGNCPLLMIADTFTSQSDVDTVHLVGNIPNTLKNGNLARTGPNNRFLVRLAYINPKGGGSIFSGGDLTVLSDIRSSIQEPATIERGSALTIKGVTEEFTRSWTDARFPVQLQFKADSGNSFDNIGAPITPNAEGVFSTTQPSVGSPGDWRVRFTQDVPGGQPRELFSNVTHVGFAAAPRAIPSEPIVTFSKGTRTSLTFNLTPPAVGAPLTEYRWAWDPGNGSKTVPAGQQGGTLEINNLKPVTKYDVTVRAVNAAGAGEIGRATGRTETIPPSTDPPLQPQKVSGSAGNHTATIRWSPPNDTNGGAIDRYQVHRHKANKFLGAGARSATFGGLSNKKTYTVFVRAHNTAGWGAWSKGVQLRPHTSHGQHRWPSEPINPG